MPEFSENAQTVLCARYFHRDPTLHGTTCRHCGGKHETVNSFVARVSMNNDEYRNELIEPLRFLPNSPTLFNIGTSAGGTLSACFKFDVDDTMFDSDDGIMPVAMKAAKVLKAGGGVGYTFHVRPEGALVNSTHRGALGPLGVMRIYHRLAKEITQGGKRDAAQMGILHCDHPDIEKFIHAKDKDPDALGTFNISVALTDEFMRDAIEVISNPAIEFDEEKTRKARILFEMAESAWLTGDPGVYFADAAERGNPTPWVGRLTGTNPCGEVPLLRNEPCNLGSINLGKMLDENNDIDYDLLAQTTKLAIRYLDDVLDVNVFPDPEIDNAARYTRKLGLGVCGFADVLTLKGIEYDSDEALKLASLIMNTISIAADLESERLGGEKGMAPCFTTLNYQGIGFRNATRTCIAPTGTIAILMGASSGIEPYFALENTRRMGDGTTLIERPWTLEHTDFRPKVANEIDFESHVKMQAVFQMSTDLAVSKTINMHNSATPEDILKAYVMMWEEACKGGTIYRDGSRGNQVLQVAETAPATSNSWRHKLPDERPSVTHKFEVGGVEGYIHVGLFDDRQPGEIFLDISRQGSSLSGFADWLGQTASVAFQIAHKYDIPFTVFTNKWIGRKFEPAGFTTNSDIPKAESISDYLGRYLNGRFASNPPVQGPTDSGESCPECGSLLTHSEGCMHCTCGYERC
jgi:ribonucleoside-diphosphate reductase alpha chain